MDYELKGLLIVLIDRRFLLIGLTNLASLLRHFI